MNNKSRKCSECGIIYIVKHGYYFESCYDCTKSRVGMSDMLDRLRMSIGIGSYANTIPECNQQVNEIFKYFESLSEEEKQDILEARLK
jgi:hypothetical protein